LHVLSKATNDLGIRDGPSARKNLSNRSTSGPFEFVKKSHDRGATLSSLSKLSTANSRSCVTLSCARAARPFLCTYIHCGSPHPRQRLKIAPAAVPAIPISAAVPSTISSPSSPRLVVVPLAVGISRVPALAVRFLRGMARVRDHVLGHCGPREHGTKNCGSAKKSDFGHGS
jgi:hypothetical protein